MDKKTKKILTIVSVVMIVIAICIVVSKLIPPTVSTDNINSKFDDVTINGLRFTNVNIVGNQLTALIQNTKSTKDSIKTITVKFFDKESNEIESVDAYIGGKIEANEMKKLDVKTDADLSNVGNITYQINRSSCVVTRNTKTYTCADSTDSSFCRQDGGYWNYYLTGYYQCDGVSGNIENCAVTGTISQNYGSFHQNYTFDHQYTDGGTAKPGNKTYACTGNVRFTFGGYFLSGYANINFKLGNLPSQIDCSCDD